MERLERIAYFENALNELCAAERELDTALERFSAAQPSARELEEYYFGGQWMDDFGADERGELPPELPRGVLSEDGVYNALGENRELLRRMAELSRRRGMKGDAPDEVEKL
ncbi:MAG: DUF4298 domain-containing protein [Butyricicoccus sp.]|nr:DUF4298 domain-containing protein [Butyricicoccus sp.]